MILVENNSLSKMVQTAEIGEITIVFALRDKSELHTVLNLYTVCAPPHTPHRAVLRPTAPLLIPPVERVAAHAHTPLSIQIIQISSAWLKHALSLHPTGAVRRQLVLHTSLFLCFHALTASHRMPSHVCSSWMHAVIGTPFHMTSCMTRLLRSAV